MNGTGNEQLRRATERLMDGQQEALQVLRRALDEDAPTEEAEDVLGDLEDTSEGALEEARHPGNGGGGRGVIALGRNPPFAPVLTVRTEEDESSGETGDSGRVQTLVSGGTKEARGAEAARPFLAPAALSPAVVLRFRFHPDFATEVT